MSAWNFFLQRRICNSEGASSGSRDEFSRLENPRDANVMRDTFELFRREIRSIDIVTFDELPEPARFITRS
jgi:hypothetical protein